MENYMVIITKSKIYLLLVLKFNLKNPLLIKTMKIATNVIRTKITLI